MADKPRGLVVLDIDGVILQGQLLLSLAWRMGPWHLIRMLWNCLSFDRRRITLEELLSGVYARLRCDESWVWDTYRSMKITPGSREAVQRLKKAGWKVVLLSAGVPDAIVGDLVNRLGADGGAGMGLEVVDGKLTGNLTGEMIHSSGKPAYVERMLEKEGLDWRSVAVVGDDRNNIPLMERAGISVGFNATQSVRRSADFIVDIPDLRAVADVIENPRKHLGIEQQELTHPIPRKPWFKEIRRKGVHLMAAVIPLLSRLCPVAVPVMLIFATFFYLISEIFRLNGMRFPIIWRVTNSVIRESERRELAVAPLTLVLGVGLSLLLFESHIAFACIFMVAFADSTAAVVGERWGRIPIPYSRRKTLEGTLTCAVVGVISGMVFLQPTLAVAAGATAAAVESFELRDWDNIFIPVCAGITVSLLAGL